MSSTHDDIISFTIEEQHQLRESYNILKKESSRNGTALYMHLFQDYPQYKSIFPRFRHLNDEFLMSTGELKNQGDAYMNGMSELIDALGDQTHLTKLVKHIADMHKQRGVSKDHVVNMCPIYIALIKSAGGKIDPQCEAAWAKLFGGIAELIEKYKHEQK